MEESNGRIADAAVVMAKSSQRKAELEEKRLALLREREQNRIIFAALDGLDEVSKYHTPKEGEHFAGTTTGIYYLKKTVRNN